MKNLSQSIILSMLIDITTINLNKNHIVYKENDKVEYIYFIYQGACLLQKIIHIDDIGYDEYIKLKLKVSKIPEINKAEKLKEKRIKEIRVDILELEEGSFFGDYEIN